MLILTRRVEQSIVIAETIVIKIVENRCGKIRLGIIAPQDIPVHREEVFVAIHGQQKLDNLFAGVVS